MSLILQKVELTNIRSHEHLVFEPESSGVTAISGPNGSGKSTIVDSVAWALYGSKPSGVSKASAIYRDGAVWGVDKCSADVQLLVDSVPYRIVRRMVNKGGGVECEVFRAESDGSWSDKPVAGPSVSHTAPFIKQLLKMDEKGFLASVLIQQKQVDQLISSSPRERGLVIEKLTGITSITEAITQARQEYNVLRQALALSTVSPEGASMLRQEKKSIESKQANHQQLYSNLKAEVIQLKQEGSELQSTVEAEEEAITRSTTLREELSAFRALVTNSEKQLAALIERKDSLKSELSVVMTRQELDALELRVEALREQQSEINTQTHLNKQSLGEFEVRLHAYRKIIDQHDGIKINAATEKMTDILERLRRAQHRVRELERDIDRGQSSTERLQNAIGIISDADEGQCPTCLQKVSDVDSAVHSLQDEINSIEAERSKKQGELEGCHQFAAQAEAEIADLAELIDALTTQTEVRGGIASHRSQLAENVKQEKAISSELKAVVKTFDSAKQNELKMESYNRLLSECRATSDEIELLQRQIQTKSTESKASVPMGEHNGKKRRLAKLRESYMTKSNSLTKLTGELRLLVEQISNLDEKISRSDEELRKNKMLLKSVEVARNTISVLDEFRADRIESSVPLIESYASDFLNRFTEGKITQLKLNSKFEASVGLATGGLRAIGLLSGGELSAAALALRLAISRVIEGGSNHSLIIMDEVFVSQDASHSEIILASVKEICNGQTILIAHNETINDFADQVTEL